MTLTKLPVGGPLDGLLRKLVCPMNGRFHSHPLCQKSTHRRREGVAAAMCILGVNVGRAKLVDGTAVEKQIYYLTLVTSTFDEYIFGAKCVEMGYGRCHVSHIINRQARQ